VPDSVPQPDSGRPSKSTQRRTRHKFLQIVAWCSAGSTLLLLLAAATLAVLLNNTRFHNYLLNTVRKQASESLGVRVELRNFALHLSTLSLDLYGVTVNGASPYSNRPLLQLQHVEAGVRVVSILHGKWYLNSVQVDHPIVQIFIDKNGISNIPTIKSGNSKSNSSIFDVGIRHAVLDYGEVFYNDQPNTLAVDLHNVDFRSAFNSLLLQYSGKLSYTGGHLVFGSFRPFAHDLDAEFDATPTTFHLTSAKITSGASQIILSAIATNYSNPSVDAQYDVTVDGSQLAKLLDNTSVLAGLVRASGSAQYHTVPGRPMLESLSLKGDLASRQITVNLSTVRTAISNVAAHYSLANGDATLHDSRGSILGGEVTAQGTMKNMSGNSHSEITTTVRGVSLADARRMLGPSASTPGVGLAGVLNADAKARWGKTFDDLVAHADATISGKATRTQAFGPTQANASANGNVLASTVIPVDSEVHATYTAGNHQLALTQSYLRTQQTNLTMNGVVSHRSSLALRLQANDLRELTTVANIFRTSSPDHPTQPIDLAGTATFEGTVNGSTVSPQLKGELIATHLHVNGTDWKVFRTNVDVSSSMASLQHADLEPESHGRITFNGSTGLSKWSFSNASPIQIELDASQINIGDVTKLTGQLIPVTGALNSHVSLHGTELNPMGSGTVSLTKVTAYDEPINSVKVDFSGSGDEAHADVSVQFSAGSLKGNVSVRPKDKTYTAQLSTSGIKVDQVEALKARKVEASGAVNLNADGQGSFDNPQLNATLQIPSLVIQKQTIEGIKLQMNLANHVANATLASSAVHTSIQANARVNLTGDYLTDATLDTKGIPLQPLLAAYSPEQAAAMTGETEVHATLHGPLKNRNLLEAHVTIPYLRMAYNNNIQLAAVSPIEIDYKNAIIDVQRSAIRGTDTDLQFQGSIPTARGNTPMSLLLEGTVNLQLAQLFDPDVRSSGELKLHINSNGTGPNLGGEIDIVDASYASSDLPVGLQHGNGVLTLTSDRINISKFDGTVGSGTVTAQGGIAYRPAIQFDLGLAAKGIRILYPQGMRESIDANIRLAGSMDDARLGGSVDIADLSFTPAFDLNSFISQFSGSVAAPPSRGFSQNVQLNLAVHSTNNVNLVSRALSVNGSANLQVRGTAANPVILGRVNLNGGDIILNGDRFVLSGGTVQFVNPSETQSVVNLSLTTTIQQYNIDLRFNGPIDQLRTQYSSDPALPSADIINLLAFGQTTEASAVNSQSTTTNQAAESLVASQVSSQVTSRISKIAGISQLSISPVLGSSNSQGTGGANITVQQRVTGNLFITFSTNTSTTQGQVIQGQYQVSPRVAVSATRDPNGGFAMDALIKKSW
jgi:translocation and assembly module TamB